MRLELTVKEVKPSKLEGMRLASAEGEGRTATFDMAEELYVLSPGDRVEVVIDEKKPDNVDEFEFCGHGYLVTDEGKGYTLLSLWGLLFKFAPPLGLKTDTKYYLCMRRLAGAQA